VKIAIVAPPWFTVPPTGHGGIETFLDVLIEELVERAEEVILYSVPGSHTRAMLRFHYSGPQQARLRTSDHLPVECAHSLFAFQDAIREGVDLIHDHSGRVGVTMGALGGAPPILHTVHGTLAQTTRDLYRLVARSQNVHFTTISHRQRASMPDLPVVTTIHHGIDATRYPFVARKQPYLLCVSRICPEKGCHLAIAASRSAGMPLKLAGLIEPTEEGKRYFHEQIEPQLGHDVEYLGEVGAEEKSRLMSNATALLFPAVWPEPFGLVAIEALACGTPVIASSAGALPEIIRDGLDGFLADGVQEMAAALRRIDTIDPAVCRRRVEDAFDSGRMTDQYQDAYRAISDSPTAHLRIR
jgi:glycosyltransferase involved in cell wall biosynthesis